MYITIVTRKKQCVCYRFKAMPEEELTYNCVEIQAFASSHQSHEGFSPLQALGWGITLLLGLVS